MAVLLDYVWQSTFCLFFFYGIYHVFLRNEKAFILTRIFILLTPLLAMLFPILKIPVSFYKPDITLEQSQFFRALTIPQAPDEIAAYLGLPEVTVQSTKLPLLWEFLEYFILTYLLVVFLLAIKLFWDFIQLRFLFEKGWYQTVFNLTNNYFLIPTFGMAPVFSYFNKLFWDETQSLDPDEKDQIINHEIEHIRQGHSWDVLYYQFLSIIFWFNPAIHLMRGALVDVHEYLADQNVLAKVKNKETYPRLIAKIAFEGIDLPIGNYFVRSTTLKRILMMKKSAKINWLKIGMTLPLTLVLLGLISMKTEANLMALDKPPIHTVDTTAIYDVVETAPLPNGGIEGWDNYLRSNLDYPSLATKSGIEGNVYAAFVVNRDGKIGEVQILHGIGGGCDEETIRLIKDGPEWTPGKQDGHAVNVRMRIPIKFKLPVYLEEKKNTQPQSLTTALFTPKKIKMSPDFLYIIDGEPLDENQDLSALNPTEITNFQILKNKEFLDLYGAKGKIGVMLITTKKHELQ